ncbi:MAG: T9SS type A sorting domain-containing protein, partial [Candidatus Zixiibacteriota bacterium]
YYDPTGDLEFVNDNSVGYKPFFKPDTFIIAARNLNHFPVDTLPTDVDTALVTPQLLCIPGIWATDEDDGDLITLEKIEGPGTFDPNSATMPDTLEDTICFMPENVDSTYMFVFKLSDQCPAEVYDTFHVTVNISGYPYLTVPDDVDTFLCDVQSLCIDSIIATDPDTGDTIILEMLEGPGVFDPDTGVGPDSIVTSHCFTPANKDSTYRLIFLVTDSTGLSDEDTFYVSVDMEEPPSLSVPLDVDTCLPPGSNLCIKYLEATDGDTDDTLILEMVSGPGSFVPDTGLSPISDSICFDPESNDSTYELIFKVTDSCDSTRQDTFYATVNVNQPPVVTLPADIDTFLCDPQEICFDSLIAFDPDSGDTFVVDMIEGSGTFDPDTGVSPDSIVRNHCFTPAANDSTYRFIFEIIDPCGETDRDTFNLTVDINDPPLIFAPETLWVIENSAKFDTFTATDPESHIIIDSAGVTLAPDCGEYYVTRISGSGESSGQWEVSFSDTGCGDSVFTMIVDLRDTSLTCTSKVRYDTIMVIIRSQTSYNNPPVVTAPGEIIGTLIDTLVLTFTAADPDNDIILDTFVVNVLPVSCGSTSTERLTPSGTPSGEWKVTFYTEGCSDGVYWIDLNLQDFLGAWGWDSVKVTLKTVDVPETSSIDVSGFILGQNYPNPFNQKTSLSFEIPYECHLSLKIYNLSGQLVNTLADRRMGKGQHTIYWDGTSIDGRPVASGIYFYKLNASDFVSVRKMILLK